MPILGCWLFILKKFLNKNNVNLDISFVIIVMQVYLLQFSRIYTYKNVNIILNNCWTQYSKLYFISFWEKFLKTG